MVKTLLKEMGLFLFDQATNEEGKEVYFVEIDDDVKLFSEEEINELYEEFKTQRERFRKTKW